MRVRQLVRLGALCAAALMLCSCDFLGFDGDIEPDGWEAKIRKVERNNRIAVQFNPDDVDDWDFPEKFRGYQWIELVGVEPLIPSDADGEKGHLYGDEAKQAVERYRERTVYIELPDEGLVSAGFEGNEEVYWALVYPDYDSHADKVSLNEIILRNGWGLYDELYVPDLLQWDFEQAAEDAKIDNNGYWRYH